MLLSLTESYLDINVLQFHLCCDLTEQRFSYNRLDAFASKTFIVNMGACIYSCHNVITNNCVPLYIQVYKCFTICHIGLHNQGETCLQSQKVDYVLYTYKPILHSTLSHWRTDLLCTSTVSYFPVIHLLNNLVSYTTYIIYPNSNITLLKISLSHTFSCQ